MDDNKTYIPKTFPEKCVLLGGGMFANYFMVVNVLSVKEVPHFLQGHENETVPQVTVEQRKYDGSIEIFTPYLWSYYLAPLNPKYKDIPLDTYIADFQGGAEGRDTKYVLKNENKEVNNETKTRRKALMHPNLRQQR